MNNSKAESKLKLFIGLGCPFCTRVTNFIEAHDIKIDVVDVWTNDAGFREMLQLSGSRQVPCLKIGDSFMLESLDIIAKLKELEGIH